MQYRVSRYVRRYRCRRSNFTYHEKEACGCLAGRLQARVCGLSLQAYRLHFSSVCDVQRYSSCSCRLWCYIISVMPSPVPLVLSGYLLYVKTF